MGSRLREHITTALLTLTDANSAELWGDQGAAAELVVGRRGGPVEEAIGPGGLERGRGSGWSRRWSRAQGRLQREPELPSHLNLNMSYDSELSEFN